MKHSDLKHHLKSLSVFSAPAAVGAFLIVIQALLPSPDGRSDLAITVYETLGLHWQHFKSGSIWQILTYGFVHGGYWHLMVNVLGVVLIGSRVEKILGAVRFLQVCLFGILAGGAAHLIATAGGTEAPILVGFSAAVMALLLLLTTLSPDSRMWPVPVSGRSLGLGLLIAEGILALIDPALGIPVLADIGKLIVHHGGGPWFEIAHACHFGGGIAGWLYGRWILRNRVTRESLRRARERGERRVR